MSEEQKDFLVEYIMQLQDEKYNLQQENKQLKEEIEEYKRIEQEDLIAFNNYDSILTELEEWCKSKIDEVKYNSFDEVLDKIQELKEKKNDSNRNVK